MIGERYWSTGITVWRTSGGWFATLSFYDGGFAQPGATEGQLGTRYALPTVTAAIALAKADAERLGIEWHEPTIYYRGDGEEPEYSPPAAWAELVSDEAKRLGWKPCYR